MTEGPLDDRAMDDRATDDDAVDDAAVDGAIDDAVDGDDDAGAGEGDAGPLVVTVPALLDGVRIDRAVSMLTGVSRAVAADLVTTGRVQLDGRPPASRSVVLATGQALSVEVPDAGPGHLEPEPDVEVDVVYADDELVVVDKPAGLVVHPGAGHARGTLAAGLLARFPDLAALSDSGVCDPLRPGIVHRLDRGTSGLLAVARTAEAYHSLVGQLAARTVDRRYLALVAGHPDEDRGVVDAPIGRSSRSPTRMAVSSQGRPARTSYRVLERYGGEVPASLLLLTLQTGRTHQIRVHLSAIGHPLVGDPRYGRAGNVGPTGARLPDGRQFLHAARLGLDHPGTGERLVWRSALPGALRRLLPDLPEELRPDGVLGDDPS